MKQRPIIARSVPLLDYEIERGTGGRTVVAYAATFDSPYEVSDFDGHYDEIINRAAFNRTISRGIGSVQVLYNHGRSLGGTPAAEFSLPIAVPLEVKADTKGLITRSRYLNSPLADTVLEAWAEGAIRAQSFRGPIFRSLQPRAGGANGRPIIERMELGLIEYGPALFAANDGAGLVAIRSLLDDTTFDELTDEERSELLRRLTEGPHVDPASAPVDMAAEELDPLVDPSIEEPVDPASSVESLSLAAAQRRRRL